MKFGRNWEPSRLFNDYLIYDYNVHFTVSYISLSISTPNGYIT